MGQICDSMEVFGPSAWEIMNISSYITYGANFFFPEFRSYLTFLPYLFKRKHVCSWVTAGDMPALISECDSVNSILVCKQTELILDTDKAMKANHTWKIPSASLN